MYADWPVISTLIAWPLIASLALLFPRSDTGVRQVALATGVLQILLAVPLLDFNIGSAEMQFVEQHDWITAWNISYHVGIDGLSYLMILLTVILLPMCVLCSWNYITARLKEFHICLMLMTSACIGVFTALDLVVFYIFWEVMLVPMFLLIAVWGGPERRYASLKFFLYTLAGSTMLLVAIIAFYVNAGTFSVPELMQREFSFSFQYWTFLAMALAFAIKVPMFPFHTWLPAAHVQAPTAGSVLLASVLLKMGTYGFIRFCLGLTPQAMSHFAPLFIGISLVSITYGGFVALGQRDIKKLIAYSSVAHMGFVTLGIFLLTARGLEGAIIQMVNHGVTTGALFMLVGMIYERSHSRDLADNMGLGKFLPAYMFFMGLFSLSSLGFPGTNGFVGEAMILIAAFTANPLLGMLAIPGALLAAAYMLRLLQKLAWGSPINPETAGWNDLSAREWLLLTPLALLVLYLGLAPGLALQTMAATVAVILGL